MTEPELVDSVGVAYHHPIAPNRERSLFSMFESVVGRAASLHSINEVVIELSFNKIDSWAERARIEGVEQYLKDWPEDVFAARRSVADLKAEDLLVLMLHNVALKVRQPIADGTRGGMTRCERRVSKLAVHLAFASVPVTPRTPAPMRSG